jgi:hypothetical protein
MLEDTDKHIVKIVSKTNLNMLMPALQNTIGLHEARVDPFDGLFPKHARKNGNWRDRATAP